MGMSLALPFFNSVIIVLISSVVHSTFAHIHTRRIRVWKVIVKTRNLINLKLAYLIISIILIRCKGYKTLVKLICNISTVC